MWFHYLAHRVIFRQWEQHKLSNRNLQQAPCVFPHCRTNTLVNLLSICYRSLPMQLDYFLFLSPDMLLFTHAIAFKNIHLSCLHYSICHCFIFLCYSLCYPPVTLPVRTILLRPVLFVLLRDLTVASQKGANQDVWPWQAWYKVKSLLPTPNLVITSPYPWEAGGSPEFMVPFCLLWPADNLRASLVY